MHEIISAPVVPITIEQQAYSSPIGASLPTRIEKTAISASCSKSCSKEVVITLLLARKYPLKQAETAIKGRLGARILIDKTVLESPKKTLPSSLENANIIIPNAVLMPTEIIRQRVTQRLAIPFSPLAR